MPPEIEMKRITGPFLFLLLIILPACQQAQLVATDTEWSTLTAVTGTITPAEIVVPADDNVRIIPAPIQGTPETDPRLTLHVNLVDGQTGQPVRGDVLVGNETCRGEIVYRDVSQFAVELPGQAEDPIYLCILADGYETWLQGYRYHLEHSRTATFTVNLNLVTPRGDH